MTLEENIRQSLATLERNLETIRSARDQVNEVVDRGQELNRGIEGIVTSLNDFKKEVNTNWGSHISELKETGKGVAEKLDSRIQELDKRIKSLEQHSEKLKENIDKLGGFDDKIDRTKTEITAAVTQGNQNLVKLEEQSTEENAFVRKAMDSNEMKTTALKELVQKNNNQIGKIAEVTEILQAKVDKTKTNSTIAMIVLIVLFALNVLMLFLSQISDSN